MINISVNPRLFRTMREVLEMLEPEQSPAFGSKFFLTSDASIPENKVIKVVDGITEVFYMNDSHVNSDPLIRAIFTPNL